MEEELKRWKLSLWLVLLWKQERGNDLQHVKISGVYFLAHSACLRAQPLQSCPTLCDPMDSRVTVPLSMGFSRQEYWSGLPCPLLQGIFLNQRSNHNLSCLLHRQVDSLPLEPPGKPFQRLEHKYLWVSFLAYHTVVLNLYQSPESPGKFVKTKYWDPLPEFLIQ